MKVYQVFENGDEKFIQEINHRFELLDIVIKVHSDGNYNYYDEDARYHVCHRDNGEQFYLRIV